MSEHKAPNVKVYLAVFAALMALTVVTVLVSYWHLPMLLAVALGMAIATLKAGLVGAVFMHLKGEKALIYWLLVVTVFFGIHLIIWPIMDSSALAENRASHVP